MCLAVPGQVVAIDTSTPTPMGVVDFDGIRKEVCLAYLPDVRIGDYALVHVGFAIAKVDEESAHRSLALWADIDALEQDEGSR
ncbi:MAG: HypC/HybG/HupF family hydrogenase formation chaperone [Acidimicrobiia bacterium]|nr:HypC/HybG/HupF family hydrogenase formation chaperone [Acidimicrobiia bacterium]